MAGNGISRRAWIGSAAALVAGCGRTRSPRYPGWLFVATANESGIAVADLANFHRVTTIALPKPPRQILRAGTRVFATCPEASTIYEIDPNRLAIAGKIVLPGPIGPAVTTPDGTSLIAISRGAPQIVDLSNGKVRQTPVPGSPTALDASRDTVAVTTENGNLACVALKSGVVSWVTPLGLRCGLVRFRNDGKAILTGAADQNQIVTVDAASGSLLARLPLAFLPKRFCFSDDGGQMFVTGSSDDSIIVVSPYQSEVDQTMIAGQKPYGMAVAVTQGRNLLFVTNGGGANLTIFDVYTRQLASSVHVGGRPGEVLITPDGNYALVIDRDSGDVAVVKMSTALDHKLPAYMSYGTRPLFTVFPTGLMPQSAAIIPKAG